MAKTFALLKRQVSLSEALAGDTNILAQLPLVQKQADFFTALSDSAHEIEATVASHLAIPRETCKVVNDPAKWISGSFNVCIPLLIQRPGYDCPQKVLIRVPLPFKLGEEQSPGNAEEKLRSEAATYVWMQENCPTVPIPRLLGFGLPDGLSFTPLQAAPAFHKVIWYMNRIWSWLRRSPLPCHYIKFSRKELLNIGYLLLEHVEEGSMLSDNWALHLEDEERRSNLFCDLSRIILSMAQVPLPRIGSWTIDNNGILSLTNRPLTALMPLLENEGIPANVSTTYDNVDSYYLDLLEHHDNRMKYQPNSIHDQDDGKAQLSSIALMKSLMRHFTDHRLRHGPFVMQLTDLHPSNIFVDQNWHITRVIDLEWACARPVEMLVPPFWLTRRSLDGLFTRTHLAAYTAAVETFMTALRTEQKSLFPNRPIVDIVPIMRATWDSGGYWFWQALDAPDCLDTLFQGHIQNYFLDPQSRLSGDYLKTYSFWTPNADRFIQEQIRRNDDYLEQLKDVIFKQENTNMPRQDDSN